MNNENLFLRLVTSSQYESVRRIYRGPIFSREIGDLRLVVVRKPVGIMPENLFGLKVADVDIDEEDEDIKNGSTEKLFIRAGGNTRKSMPPRLFFTEHIGNVDMFHSGVLMEEEYGYGFSHAVIDRKRSMGGMRLTSTSWFGGAVAVFCPGVAKRLSEALGADLYITFPSPHESRVHSVKWNTAQEVHNAISNWNAVTYRNRKGDVFSRGLFRYCAVRDEIQPIEYYEWKYQDSYGII